MKYDLKKPTVWAVIQKWWLFFVAIKFSGILYIKGHYNELF